VDAPIREAAKMIEATIEELEFAISANIDARAA
jgi:hypothetical protein